MAETGKQTAYALSADRYTMVIRRRTPDGIQTLTLRRQDDAGPFTDEDVAAALEWSPGEGAQQPGQRNITRRAVTRAGTLWSHVMLGPPTWWLPRVKREKDGTVMAGWLRLAVAAKWERAGSRRRDGGSDG
jgi:hypothetical protein